jgi:uncharacterized membrane protein (DUF373 family)
MPRGTSVAAHGVVQQRRRDRQIEYVIKFERAITSALVVMMAIVVVLATVDLAYIMIRDFLSEPLALLDLHEFLGVFGSFLLVLIGIELLETLRAYAREAVIRAEVIVLVALIALARKIIILEPKDTSYASMIGTAALLLALGVTYFLVRKTHEIERIEETT